MPAVGGEVAVEDAADSVARDEAMVGAPGNRLPLAPPALVPPPGLLDGGHPGDAPAPAQAAWGAGARVAPDLDGRGGGEGAGDHDAASPVGGSAAGSRA